MRQDSEGIAVFVAMRFSAPPSKDLKKLVGQMVQREKGLVEDCQDPKTLMTRFANGSTALGGLERIQRHFSKDPGQEGVSMGVELGELLSGQGLPNNSAFNRSQELADLASSGQVLIGPAARELLRPTLPAGFGLLELGDVRLGRGISAEKISQLLIKGMPIEFPRIDALDEVLSNVPEMSDFIGRDVEAHEVRRALADSQVVTLVGPAGVGKSSLANWISMDLAEAYRDGTWLVDFGKIPRGGNVATAIAADLKLPMMPNHTAEERVLIGLSTMQGLVWLDNCEHVLGEVRELLPKTAQFCTGVRFLATSRTKLNIAAEKVLDLHPFSVPTNPEHYADSEAVRLFMNRARRASADFVATHENMEASAEICRRVDGLPLAIELAAAQVARMPVTTLSKRLNEALTTSQDGVSTRHRTLERALAWSYSLLEPSEQKFFRHLGVLKGSTCRELTLSAGAVGQSRDAVPDAQLQALLDASLVVDDSTRSGHRYRLLEPLRQFALNQLERNDEEKKAKNEFLSATLAWVRKLVEAKVSASRLTSLLGREYSNLVGSLDWGLQAHGLGVECLALAHELYNYWLWNGPFDKGADYLERAIQKGKKLDGVEPGILYNQLGLLAGYAGHYDKAEAAFLRALELFKRAGLRRRMAAVYCNFALHVRNSGDVERAIGYGRRSLEFSDPEDPNLLKLLGNHAADLAESGLYEEAKVHLRKAMELNEAIGDPVFIATHRSTAAYLDFVENNTAKGEQNLNMSLAYYRLAGDVQGLLSTIEFAAMLALRFGRYGRAAKLFGGTAAHFLKAGVGRNIPDMKRRDDALTTIESMLGREEAEALYAVGALMSLDELYDFSRSGPDLDADPLGF